MNLLEELTIRFLTILDAFDPRDFGDVCSPLCRDKHTYQWGCRGRIKKPKISDRGSHYDTSIKDPLLDESRLE